MILDTDPDYRLLWRLLPYNGGGEPFEWELKAHSEYLPLGEKGYTPDEVETLNALFLRSEYKHLRQSYTMGNYREKYEEFATVADNATKDIKRQL